MVMLAAICSVLSVFTQWKIRCLQEKITKSQQCNSHDNSDTQPDRVAACFAFAFSQVQERCVRLACDNLDTYRRSVHLSGPSLYI
jgi:hypothetical protein